MYRVDNIPWYLQPFFQLFGWSIGLAYYAYALVVHATCRIRFIGAPLPTDSPAIYCIWHKDLLLYFSVFKRVKKQAWMSHPAWYMHPVQIMKRLTGIGPIFLGSSGNSGKAALAKVNDCLRRGYSTTVATDGPGGPPGVLKPGILLMSRDTGVPVVPLHFSCSKYHRIGGWDRKVMPGLFSTITVQVGEPVYVHEENMEEAGENIQRFLREV